MQRFPRSWNKLTCVDFLQRKIIINSIAYYELDQPYLTDKEYDELCRRLVALYQDVDISATQYGYCMADFDGSTGFDLYSRLNEHDRSYLTHLARLGLRLLGVNCAKEKPLVKKKKGGLF